MQPRPPANLPYRQPLNEPHPPNLRPLLHTDHPSSPDPIDDDRARLETPPDDTRVVQFSTGVGGPVFSRRRHGLRVLRWRMVLSRYSMRSGSGLLTSVAFVIGQASAASPPGTSLQCSWHTHFTSQGYRYKGALVGAVKCSHPFGKGVYHGRYRDNIREPTAASETGSSKLSFKAGTVSRYLYVGSGHDRGDGALPRGRFTSPTAQGGFSACERDLAYELRPPRAADGSLQR